MTVQYVLKARVVSVQCHQLCVEIKCFRVETHTPTYRVILDVLAVSTRRRYLEHAAAVGAAGHLHPWPEVLIQRHVPQQHSLRPQTRLTNEKRLQVPDQCAAEVRVPLATRAFYDDNSGAVTELHVYIALYHVVIGI